MLEILIGWFEDFAALFLWLVSFLVIVIVTFEEPSAVNDEGYLIFNLIYEELMPPGCEVAGGNPDWDINNNYCFCFFRVRCR
jgi:hypothetical protein